MLSNSVLLVLLVKTAFSPGAEDRQLNGHLMASNVCCFSLLLLYIESSFFSTSQFVYVVYNTNSIKP